MLYRILKFTTKLFGRKRNLKLLKRLSKSSRIFAAYCHSIQMRFEWSATPQPDWFDHYCDQFYQFRISQNPLWIERGVFGLLAIKQDADVLELCSGDGYYTYHFYSIRARNIKAIDYDLEALSHAKEYNQAKNIEYILSDIRNELPDGLFDNIIWDASILLFSKDEIDKIMGNIKARLNPNGIFLGYTVVEPPGGHKGLGLRESILSKEDLAKIIRPYFKNVKVFETNYPSRHNLYFYASEQVLPFDQGWESVTSVS